MRQFIVDAVPDKNGLIVVTGKDFHYLANVLRSRAGDMIDVRLLDQRLVQMTVAKVDQVQKEIQLQLAGNDSDISDGQNVRVVTDTVEGKVNFDFEIYLFQFVAMPAKMELIIRQATECGVQKIIPVAGQYSQSGGIKSAREAADKFGKGGRWDKIVVEARQQSGSEINTTVGKVLTVEQACNYWKEICNGIQNRDCVAIVLYERNAGSKMLMQTLTQFDSIKKAAVFVGCEGGISPEEIEILKNAGVKIVHLATNILRCETASLYGVASLQSALLEKNLWQDRE